jgi:hypothetical protein
MRQLLLRAHLAPDRFLAQGRAYYFEATFYDAIMTLRDPFSRSCSKA